MTLRAFRKDQMRNIAAKTRKPRKEEGFSLLEVLIAISIFSIGILAVATMQISAINGNASARRHTEAATFAADRAERLMALPYDHAELAAGAHPGSPSWTVTDDTPVPNTKTVNVIVTWSDRGTQKSLSLDFIKARDV